MGKFTEQMASLTESVVASRRDCILTVKSMLSEFGRAQASMAHQQKSSLAAGCSARAHQVGSMRREHREDQSRMGRDLRRGLAQATHQISMSVASLRADSSKEHAAMARAQQTQFTRDGQARVKGNDKLMGEFSVSRQNMSQKLSQDLENFALSIRNETDVMLGGFKQTHGEMAGQLRKMLSADTASLRGDVTKLRRGFNKTQNELRGDMQAAAQIWNNRNSRGPAMSGETSTAAVTAEGGSFGMAEKVMKKSDFEARAADYPETEAKSQPGKHGSKMPDEERVLQVVQENLNGISASQIGEQVSLPAIEIGKIMKGLIEKGEARRVDGTRLYAPSKGG
jgi:hypothetical protein